MAPTHLGRTPVPPDSAPRARFVLSRAGVAEVDIAWLREHAAATRVVDVREQDELESDGAIAESEHVPLARLAEAAVRWSPREPIVLVCRSGRRSSRAVLLLERLGFTRVASLTGGMVAWTLAGFPVERTTTAGATTPTAVEASAPIDAQSLEEALRETPPRHVRAASLLLFGSESCVDGREEHAVLGTPGGDAGELLLALATVEDLIGRALQDREVASLFDAYTKGFGRFYFHTDDDALDRLRVDLSGDSRFRELALADRADAVADLVSHPPPELRDALIEHLLKPENVGCGHLRLILTDPRAYGVRLELARTLGRVAFEHLWDEPDTVELVVLTGHHEEEAVVNVSLGREVHAFTNVPAIPPRIAGHSVFVNHPEVAAFVRREHAKFLFGELPALAATGITLDRFHAVLAEKARAQLRLTLGRLAANLPVFELSFTKDGPCVTTLDPGSSRTPGKENPLAPSSALTHGAPSHDERPPQP